MIDPQPRAVRGTSRSAVARRWTRRGGAMERSQGAHGRERTPRTRAGRTHGRVSAALLVVAATGLLGCATRGEPAPNLTDSYAGAPSAVLGAAAGLLRRQGFEVTDFDETFLELQGEKVEVARRTDGSLTAGTVVTQQVLIDAAAEADRTRLNALFTVIWRRPTGERRNFVPESPVSQRLRDAFYAELHREVGDADGSNASR
jgi:hypothetical protein